MKQYFEIGRKIYNRQNLSEYQHILVFVARALLHNNNMNELIAFLRETPLRNSIMEAYPAIYAQATRPFFFRESTFQERATLIKEHFSFFENRFSAEALRCVYGGDGIVLWSMDYQNETLSLNLHFRDVNKKEGLMTAIFKIGQTIIYQLVFWVTPDKNGNMAIWIGALQGIAGGSDVIRAITKLFFGYRPKNIMLRVVRVLGKQLHIEQIQAVSNFGFYDSTLPTHKQKLRTSLDEFWQETGGSLSADPRFYALPLIEPQKTIEEVVSHKRNLYRKRYALLDEIDESIAQVIGRHLITNAAH